MSYLTLQHVAKRFGDRIVLHDINLTVAPNEFVCIVGYSGAGKTTLINLIAGLTTPDSGQIRLNGTPVTGPGLDRALIFQNYSLLPWLSALRNVELAVRQRFPEWTAARAADHARRYLEKVKLGHALDRRPAELSGGMRQRVALARGLAMEPDLLLLDEPLSALDALTRSELQDELLRILDEEQKTILMITNDVDEAILLADRVVPLTAGPAATLGEPVPVTVARPRLPHRLNFDPNFRRDRKAVLQYLLANGPRDVKSLSSAAATPGLAAWEAVAT